MWKNTHSTKLENTSVRLDWLFVTEIKLDIPKYYCIPMICVWKRWKAKWYNPSGTEKTITIKQYRDIHIIEIYHQSPDKAAKWLGIRFSCNDHWETKWESWLRHTLDFANRVTRAKLDIVYGIYVYMVIWVTKFPFGSSAT